MLTNFLFCCRYFLGYLKNKKNTNDFGKIFKIFRKYNCKFNGETPHGLKYNGRKVKGGNTFWE